MLLQDMINDVNTLADDIVDNSTITSWLNAGKDRMAQRANATFPDLSATNLDGTFVFDAKWHRIPVLYAAAKYKEMDSAVQEVGNYMNEFNELCDEFASKYNVPVIYRDNNVTQQFVGSSTGPNGTPQTYTITKDTFTPFKSQVQVYINNVLQLQSLITDNGDYTFTIDQSYNVQPTDQITAIWNEFDDGIQPPYSWWAYE